MRTQGLLPADTSRFDVVAAYYLIASRYHSGQASTGYRKLSQCVRLGFRPGHSFGERQDAYHRENCPNGEREHAALLLRKRRKDIRRNW